MKWPTGIRVVALLRRIARALEASNALARERLALDHPEWGRHAGLRRSSRLLDIREAKVGDWNDKWRREHPEPPEVA